MRKYLHRFPQFPHFKLDNLKFFTLLVLMVILSMLNNAFGQDGSVGIGTEAPYKKAILDISSTSKGLLIPRLTLAERNALHADGVINKVMNGMLIYNATADRFNFWLDDKWYDLSDGPIGPQGIQGIKGDKDDIGDTGPIGLTGATGAQGIQGIKGDKGDIGDTGPIGLTGAAGPQGIQGTKEDKGDIGDTGPIGLTGATGAQGIQGIKGDIGDTGPIGLTGPAGPQGIQGIKGDKGDIGDTGPIGLTGAAGPQGIQGIKGDKGDIGDTGPDDFGILFKNDSAGYISSNREGGLGLDDIYQFKINPVKPEQLLFAVEGEVIDRETRLPLDAIKIFLVNKTTGKDTITLSDAQGKFRFELDDEMDYTVRGDMKKYFSKQEGEISTKNLKISTIFNVTFELEKADDAYLVKLNNIYYDFDKWNIRMDAIPELGRVVNFMNSMPDVNIELRSHTDSRGPEVYNQWLSQKRAESAVNYLQKSGIGSGRLTAQGLGETQLANRCADGIQCTKAEHQLNRRTEFKVVRVNPVASRK